MALDLFCSSIADCINSHVGHMMVARKNEADDIVPPKLVKGSDGEDDWDSWDDENFDDEDDSENGDDVIFAHNSEMKIRLFINLCKSD